MKWINSMSILKNRVSKLEASLPVETRDIHIARIIVDPGGIEPIGYRCGEVEVIRQPDEADAELIKRCRAAVVWPSGNSCHSFHPIYADAPMSLSC